MSSPDIGKYFKWVAKPFTPTAGEIPNSDKNIWGSVKKRQDVANIMNVKDYLKVIDNNNDVLIAYYTNSGDYCKEVKDDFKMLAAHYSVNDKVTIALCNVDFVIIPPERDQDVYYVPTIRLFRAGRKDSPLEYFWHDDMLEVSSLEGYTNFMKEKGKYNTKPIQFGSHKTFPYDSEQRRQLSVYYPYSNRSASNRAPSAPPSPDPSSLAPARSAGPQTVSSIRERSTPEPIIPAVPVILFLLDWKDLMVEKRCDPDVYANLGGFFSSKGFVTAIATMENESSKTTKRDGQYQDDMSAALQWITKNSKLGSDTKIFVMGNAAGARRIIRYFYDPLADTKVAGAVLVPSGGFDRDVVAVSKIKDPADSEKKGPAAIPLLIVDDARPTRWWESIVGPHLKHDTIKMTEGDRPLRGLSGINRFEGSIWMEDVAKWISNQMN